VSGRAKDVGSTYMTVTIDEAIDALRKLSPERQQELAGYIKALAEDDEPEEIDADHLPDVLEGLEQLRKGERATEDEVAAVFRKFGTR
jgi:hypothetical protein